jgi:hypothetical protein
MPLANTPFTKKHFASADRELRHAYETYVGVKAGDTQIRMRTFDEHVLWLAKELHFSSQVGGGRPSLRGLTPKDMAMWHIGSQWHSAVLRKLHDQDENVREEVYKAIPSLPPLPCIGPLREAERSGEKGGEKEEKTLRASIEHRMKVEAREEDASLVRNAEEKARSERIRAERAERRRRANEWEEEKLGKVSTTLPATSGGKKPSSSSSISAANSPSEAEKAKRTAEKEDSLSRVAEARDCRRAEIQADEARRQARKEAIDISNAILYEE